MTMNDGHWTLRKPESRMVRIVSAGDTCLMNKNGVSAVEDVLAGRGPDILRGVAPFLQDADLRVIQWEMVLTEAETPIDKKGPNLKAPPACARFAVDGNFDVALLANNHSGDYGPEPALETRDHLHDAGIQTVGVGENLDEARKPITVKRNGLSIGIVNAAENEYGLALPDRAGGAALDLPVTLRIIREAAASHDLVIVYLHGGTEHNPLPSPRMTRRCRAFVEAGANAVVCIHAHCPQGVDIVDGAPVIYCTGNFFFPKDPYQPDSFWWYGYLPRITFDQAGAVAVDLLPYHFHPDPWQVQPLEGDKRKAFFDYLSKLSALASDSEVVQRFFEAWSADRGISTMQRICSGVNAWPTDLMNREQVNVVLGIRNLLTCEAHHEMLETAMRLVEAYRVDEARAHMPELEALRSAAFLSPLFRG